jgi:phosphoribosylformimino-5-aminoimidazole carboxamide ribotide isomerase
VIVIPAVDLREGRCVRLREGRAEAETVFSDDPVAMAQRWVASGAERLHVVDLDGAFAGAPRQTALIAKIVDAVRPVPVEAGGGLRDLAAVETVLEAGVTWVVLGTRAAVDPAFLTEVCRRFGGRIIVAADARGDRVAIRGWTEAGELTVTELGRRAREAGAASRALHRREPRRHRARSQRGRDGCAGSRHRSAGPRLGWRVAAAAHIAALAAVASAGIEGVVVGRALYTGAVTLADARRAAAGGLMLAKRVIPVWT